MAKNPQLAHYHSKDKGKLLELRYPDSIYDERLFLLKDGRKRGLWIFLEEEPEARIESDSKHFQRGFDDLLKTLKKDGWKGDEFSLYMDLRRHFDLFFSHRTESRAIRLSWTKVKRLAAALLKGHKDEKHKTLEDYDDYTGKDDPEGDDEN